MDSSSPGLGLAWRVDLRGFGNFSARQRSVRCEPARDPDLAEAALSNLGPTICLIEAAFFTWIILRALRSQPARRPVTAFWFLTVLLVLGTWRLLTANNTELVHYPQYIPEGAALLALTLSPIDSMAWIAIFGGLDECFQYWTIMKGRPVGYDMNDIYMDLLGGAAGMLIAMAFLRCENRPIRTSIFRLRGVQALLGIMLAGIVLILSGVVLIYQDRSNLNYWFALSRDKPPAYWYINPLFGPHRFHTLSPVEGPILILLTLGIYTILERRVQVVAK